MLRDFNVLYLFGVRNESLVGCLGFANSLKMMSGNVTYVNDTDLADRNLGSCGIHVPDAYICRPKAAWQKGRTLNKGRADCDKFKLLILRKTLNIVPCSLLGQCLTLKVWGKTLRSVWVAPASLIVEACLEIGLVCVSHCANCSHA